MKSRKIFRMFGCGGMREILGGDGTDGHKCLQGGGASVRSDDGAEIHPYAILGVVGCFVLIMAIFFFCFGAGRTPPSWWPCLPAIF